MIRISEICQFTGGGAIQPYDDFEVGGVSTDSRLVKNGDVFVALEGENYNGHDFCQVAVQKGAKALVVSNLPQPLPDSVVVIKVKNTLKAYQDIAACHRSKFNLPVVAVTGSAGKTSTKDIIAAALSESKNVLKSQGNHNNEIGLPLTLLDLTPQHQVLVVELGMRGLGQIRELAEIARPDIAVVTNVGQTHIELLGSQENIVAAKRELVESLSDSGTAILNGDDTYVREMASATKARKLFYGLGESADITAKNIKREGLTTVFCCANKISGQEYEVRLPLLGEHNVYNALAAIAVTTVLKIDKDIMLSGLATTVLSGMRQEVSEAGGLLLVNDAYNANPAAMCAAAKMLNNMPGKRKVMILGDMLELGDMSDEAHRAVGREIVRQGIDMVVTVGDKSALISRESAEQGVRSWHFAEKTPVLPLLEEILQPGDTVLFKGSRGMRMEELLDGLKEKIT